MFKTIFHELATLLTSTPAISAFAVRLRQPLLATHIAQDAEKLKKAATEAVDLLSGVGLSGSETAPPRPGCSPGPSEGAPAARPRLLVIGVGNLYRHDDAVGLVVARGVRKRASDAIAVLEREETMDLVETWRDAEQVVLIDAVSSGAGPGTVHRFDAHCGALPARSFRFSTHAFDVAEVVELARALDQLPSRLIVYGIEGKEFHAGLGLSPEVEAAVGVVVERVLEELQVKEN